MGLTKGQGIALVCFVVLVLVVVIGYSGIFEKKVSFEPRSGPLQLCGEDLLFNPEQEGCCVGTALPEVYDFSLETCCDGVVTPIEEFGCCGSAGSSFNPQTQECCAFTDEGSSVIYSPSTQVCCPRYRGQGILVAMDVYAGNCCTSDDCDGGSCVNHGCIPSADV